MNIVVKVDSEHLHATEVTLDTGETIEGVKRIEMSVAAGEWPEAILYVVPKEILYRGKATSVVEPIDVPTQRDDL